MNACGLVAYRQTSPAESATSALLGPWKTHQHTGARSLPWERTLHVAQASTRVMMLTMLGTQRASFFLH